MHKSGRLFLDAYWRFNAQDGWAIASHIALSTLTSLFPFLIFVTAMAGFVGSQSLAPIVFLYSMAAIFVYGGELNAAIMRARQEPR